MKSFKDFLTEGRSSKAVVNKLIKELMAAMGTKDKQEAWNQVSQAKKEVEADLKKAGFGVVQLGPYENNGWFLSAMGKKTEQGVPRYTLGLSAKEILKPKELAKRFIEKYSKNERG